MTRVRRIDDVFFDYGGKFVTRARGPFHGERHDLRSGVPRSLADEFLRAFDRGDDRPENRLARSETDDALLDMLVTTPPLIGSF